MRTAVITGGSRGIGRAIAYKFAENGYAVAVIYKSSKKKAGELCLNIMKKYAVPCSAYKADVTSKEDIQLAVKNIQAELGTITVLINNAGISSQSLFTDISDDEWKKMLDIHLNGAFNVTQAVLPSMLSNHCGKIVNISSMWGVIGGSCEVHYSTAKAGLIGFTKALAKETALNGINVNCVCPGVICTDMLNIFDADTLEALKDKTLLKRLGTAEEVANAVYFLSSREADYITGTVLNVNGGFFT